jgi:hypothetical protein
VTRSNKCACGADKWTRLLICTRCWPAAPEDARKAFNDAEEAGRRDLMRVAARPLVAFARSRKQPVHKQTKLNLL